MKKIYEIAEVPDGFYIRAKNTLYAAETTRSGIKMHRSRKAAERRLAELEAKIKR